MADAEVNALVTHGESNMAVIINDIIEDEMRDEIEIHEATESSHEATESSHEATVQMEGELRTVNKGVKEWKKTSDVWTYFKMTLKRRYVGKSFSRRKRSNQIQYKQPS